MNRPLICPVIRTTTADAIVLTGRCTNWKIVMTYGRYKIVQPLQRQMEHFLTDLITQSNTKNPTNQNVVQERLIFFHWKIYRG